MSETRTVSPTLEERLAAVLDAAVQIDDERGFHTGNLKSPTYAKFILAAAKEHGLVIGEGELDAAWKEAEAALPEFWFIRSLMLDRPYSSGPAWYVVAADERKLTQGRGPTPTAALQDLTRILRDSRR